ncbi:VanZ family protein [Microbacterium deminutum]|uniref:VanZ-like domain-containing protein n=1 Tax=Microbacterium deminutum TaxID=344164 RepID=A0ABP5BJH6_9MICO
MPASSSIADTRPVAPAAPGRILRDPRLWLALYSVVLAAIAFWPVPVDRGSGGMLRAISAAVPWLTYDVIESSANVLLFVPLGILLALVLPRRRWLVVPIALAVTVVIECGQALFLHQRTASVRDVVANLIGAVIGLAIVLARFGRGTRMP